jgi:hypothetical protein
MSVASSAESITEIVLALHGYTMDAVDMDELVDAERLRLAGTKVLLLQAPTIRVLRESRPSWFSYLSDFGEGREDIVDLWCLRRARHALCAIIMRERFLHPLASLWIVGLSHGGCLALDVATWVEVDAVITVVALPQYKSAGRHLRCPWYALFAAVDEVFPPTLVSHRTARVAPTLVREVCANHGDAVAHMCEFVNACAATLRKGQASGDTINVR